tara:strand:+ start:212 stop:553 length:342 start_codon:yes stop_codon:yes gene_type:complete
MSLRLSSKSNLSLVLAFAIQILVSTGALAQNNDCTCTYELDNIAGKSYFVLKKVLETSCKVLVLSRSSQSSPYLNELKNDKGYKVIGEFFTFEGARFMALGECENCQNEEEKN